MYTGWTLQVNRLCLDLGIDVAFAGDYLYADNESSFIKPRKKPEN